MPITLKESLQSLLVADLKDLIRYVLDAEAVGRKDELIERIADAMKGEKLHAIWLKLGTLQSAAVAEAVHHPQGEFSPQRFRAKYQGDPSFEVAGAQSSRYSSKKNQPWRCSSTMHSKSGCISYRLICGRACLRLCQNLPMCGWTAPKLRQRAKG